MTRSHPYRLALANNKNSLRRNFLSVRFIKPWNSLPDNNDNLNHLLLLSTFSAIAIFLNCVNIN